MSTTTQISDVSSLARRLSELEHFTVPRARVEPEVEVVLERTTRVPVPRRTRVFLRHGAGADEHRWFADLTLTAPQRPRSTA